MTSRMPNTCSEIVTSALAWGVALASLAGCAGDLDDPEGYTGFTVSSAIRPANVDPRPAGPGPAPAPTPTPGAGGGGAVPATCARAVEIFAKDYTMGGCGGAACHGVVGTPPILAVDFVTDPATLASRLSMTDGLSTCVGSRVLNVANPAQSLLLTKLIDPPPCGALMPLSSPALPAADVQCITDWVFAEAALLAP